MVRPDKNPKTAAVQKLHVPTAFFYLTRKREKVGLHDYGKLEMHSRVSARCDPLKVRAQLAMTKRTQRMSTNEESSTCPKARHDAVARRLSKSYKIQIPKTCCCCCELEIHTKSGTISKMSDEDEGSSQRFVLDRKCVCCVVQENELRASTANEKQRSTQSQN